MRRTEQTAVIKEGGDSGRKRVETMVEALAAMPIRAESLSEVAHDARNMVAALGLYCDLLEEPGVLAAPHAHYGNELRLVAAASRRLVEKLVALDAHAAPDPSSPASFAPASAVESAAGAASPGAEPEPDLHFARNRGRNLAWNPDRNLNRGDHWYDDRNRARSAGQDRKRRWDLAPAVPVSNLAAELLANRNLLSALAGPSIGLTMDANGGAQPVRIAGEDLTRVLVNLVKNAAEAMPAGGRIHISLSERPAAKGTTASAVLTVEDSGPGIPEEALETIFASGYTTRGKGNGKGEPKNESGNGGWPFAHRGLGLAISRSIVEAAGGRIAAANREQGGARFEIELPVRRASF